MIDELTNAGTIWIQLDHFDTEVSQMCITTLPTNVCIVLIIYYSVLSEGMIVLPSDYIFLHYFESAFVR